MPTLDHSHTMVLLIGASNFPFNSEIPPIPNVEVNIKSFKEILVNSEIVGIPEDNIIVSLNESRNEIEHKLLKISAAARNRNYTLLVYYTGHGIFSTEEFGLFFATGLTRILEIDGIDISTFKRLIKKSQAGRKIVILDCCHSGAFHGTMSSVRSRIQSNLKDFQGTYVMTSTASDSISLFPVDNPLQPTYFTGGLIQILEKGLDLDSEYCTLRNIFNQIEMDFAERGFPKPQQSNFNSADQIFFSKNRKYVMEVSRRTLEIGENEERKKAPSKVKHENRPEEGFEDIRRPFFTAQMKGILIVLTIILFLPVACVWLLVSSNESKKHPFSANSLFDKYDTTVIISASQAYVRKNNKWGCIDPNGKLVVDLKYDTLYEPFINLIPARFEKKLGFVSDKDGAEVVPFKYDNYIPTSQTRAYLRENRKWGCIDPAGNVVIPCKYDTLFSPFMGLIQAKLANKYGFLSAENGIEVIGFKYDECNFIADDLCAVKLNGKWGAINKNGALTIPNEYDKFFYFSDGLAAVVLGSKYGYIDLNSEVAIPFRFDTASAFDHGRALVRVKNENFYIDTAGNRLSR